MGADEDIASMMRVIGGVIRRERRNNGMTQSQLAEKAGVSEAIISLLERQERGDVKIGTIIKIIRVFSGHLTIHLL